MKLFKQEKNALYYELRYFRAPAKLALISGAGIAGLAASFELVARGYKVVIVEKRDTFDRFNVINIDVEAQRFLKKFGLFDEFETSIAARIKEHRYILFKKDGIHEDLGVSDVSQLQPSNLPFEPEYFHKLFEQDGFYSVRIKDLQTFLANKALDAGVTLLSKRPLLQPDLIFLAEGTHSTSANQFGMESKKVNNECSGENWIFGNINYAGKETFVVSVIDISKNKLEIANIIFNAKIQEINIAVTSEQYLSQEAIQLRVLDIAKRVFSLLKIDEVPQSLIASVLKPVHIVNRKRVIYSKHNIFCIGDTSLRRGHDYERRHQYCKHYSGLLAACFGAF